MSEYLNALFIIMSAILIIITLALASFIVVKDKKEVKMAGEITLSVSSKSNFLIKKQVEKKNEALRLKNEIEELKKRDVKNFTRCSDSQNSRSEAGRPKSNSAETLKTPKPVENNKEGSRDNRSEAHPPVAINRVSGGVEEDEGLNDVLDKAPYKDEGEDMMELMKKKGEGGFTGTREEIVVDYLDTHAGYGPGDDDESPYDSDGFKEFYGRTGSYKERASNDMATELRKIISEEVYGLIDKTSLKMSENFEKLNQITREITALRKEVSLIQSKPEGLDKQKIDDVLNPRLAMLRDMEIEGQMVMNEIDDQLKKESKEKYSKYSLV